MAKVNADRNLLGNGPEGFQSAGLTESYVREMSRESFTAAVRPTSGQSAA
jgi:hypothetical protein